MIGANPFLRSGLVPVRQADPRATDGVPGCFLPGDLWPRRVAAQGQPEHGRRSLARFFDRVSRAAAARPSSPVTRWEATWSGGTLPDGWRLGCAAGEAVLLPCAARFCLGWLLPWEAWALVSCCC